MEHIGTRIKQLRVMAGLTQAQLAALLGVGQPYVSGIEIGRDIPSNPLTKLICLIFNVNEEWLRTGEGPKRPASPHQGPAQVAEARTKYLNRGDVEEEDKDLADILHDIRLFWANSPPDIRTWFKVQLHIAFPQIDEVKKSVEEQGASYTA